MQVLNPFKPMSGKTIECKGVTIDHLVLWANGTYELLAATDVTWHKHNDKKYLEVKNDKT